MEKDKEHNVEMNKEKNNEKDKKENISNKKNNITEKIRENPWVVSTFVLGILTLILVVSNFSGNITGNITGNVISSEEIGDTLLNFYESNGIQGLSLVSVEEVSGLYQVNFEYQGAIVPLYVTKDGELVGSLSPMGKDDTEDSGTAQEAQDVPKSDKPVVELFIWSYCPYGVQAQGPLAEVVSLLKDKADFKVNLYHDGHGAYETQQNKIQACIQKLDSNKYWDYATGFVEDIYSKCGSSRDIDCDKTESIKLMDSLGIDSSAVMTCVESDEGEILIQNHSQRAQEFGVTGSPTLMINEVVVSSSRTAEAYKQAICDAFIDAPSECSNTLDSSTATTSGNC